jgi:hypothetical protein
MADYIVELRDSVFRETPLAEANFDDNISEYDILKYDYSQYFYCSLCMGALKIL